VRWIVDLSLGFGGMITRMRFELVWEEWRKSIAQMRWALPQNGSPQDFVARRNHMAFPLPSLAAAYSGAGPSTGEIRRLQPPFCGLNQNSFLNRAPL
jgi:hypothetical protein